MMHQFRVVLVGDDGMKLMIIDVVQCPGVHAVKMFGKRAFKVFPSNAMRLGVI